MSFKTANMATFPASSSHHIENRAHSPFARFACAAAIGGAIAALIALVKHAYDDHITYRRYDTMFGRASIYEVQDDAGSPVRLLSVGGAVQSGTYIDERYTELVFEYQRTYLRMFDANLPIERVLVIGCGGYDNPKYFVAHCPNITVDAVEVDPMITMLAKRYFFLDRLIEEYETEKTGRLNLINADGRAYLDTCTTTYDAIINDTFESRTPVASLTAGNAAHVYHEHLNPGGMYLTNIVAALTGPHAQFLRDEVAALRNEFAHVHIIPCATDELDVEDNVIVIATDGAYTFSGAIDYPGI